MPTMKTLISTKDIHPRNRFLRWRESICERIVPVEQSKLDDLPFNGLLEAADIANLQISRVSQGALQTETTPETIRRHNKHDTLNVILRLAGASTVNQHGRSSIQRPGDLVLIDRRPAVLSSSVGSRSYILEVPRARIEAALGPVPSYAALTVSSDLATAALVQKFFTELVRVHDGLDDLTAQRITSVGIDLLIASIAERLARDVPRSLHGTVVVQRAKAYVEAHLGDPTLNPTTLSAAVGVSLRRLQELFLDHGIYVSDWIWRRRLERAAQLLADPGRSHIPIGQLAYGCGFTSQAHFTRRFRDGFGLAPSEYRHRAELEQIASTWKINPENET